MRAGQKEKELLRRLKRGDKEAFDVIYEQWGGYVYNFTCKTLYNKSLAEDITQELFLRLWECRAQIDEERNFQSWLFTVARNLVYREGRRMLLNSAFIDVIQKEGAKSSGNTTDDMVNFSFTNEYITELIDQLPPARKRIYILNKQAGLSVREIAQRLNLSEKTIEVQLYHANQFMRTRFRNIHMFCALMLLASQL
ncbi:sigma-70 family RNA polymerase sigma factor [uncultured Alistipes sp.]|jgi:RNA polymerase sigma factor, sigma-70 family|uniref:RNA polymerase sigma factor n=1 Tax=uncultured Alistipes sp. TaxID=538949 RepID=UPI0025E19F8B|nr:sigma-70 family RNA polymerase sigma factor [uncultured Alistipes sp.]